jgi:hypothetical protein
LGYWATEATWTTREGAPLLVTLHPGWPFKGQLQTIELCLRGFDMGLFGMPVDPDCGGPLLNMIQR